jgi:YHS domain-containing protein
LKNQRIGSLKRQNTDSSPWEDLMITRRQLTILPIVIGARSIFGFAQRKTAETAVDPVCKIPVAKDPDLSTSYRNRTYYFCSNRDRDEFKKNPQKYVK